MPYWKLNVSMVFSKVFYYACSLFCLCNACRGYTLVQIMVGVARQQAIISARVVLDRYGHMSGNGILVICRLLYLRICPNFDNLPEINIHPYRYATGKLPTNISISTWTKHSVGMVSTRVAFWSHNPLSAGYLKNIINHHWEEPGLIFVHYPADILRNNNVVITSKRRHFDVITSKWRRIDVITTLSLRRVFSG